MRCKQPANISCCGRVFCTQLRLYAYNLEYIFKRARLPRLQTASHLTSAIMTLDESAPLSTTSLTNGEFLALCRSHVDDFAAHIDTRPITKVSRFIESLFVAAVEIGCLD